MVREETRRKIRRRITEDDELLERDKGEGKVEEKRVKREPKKLRRGRVRILEVGEGVKLGMRWVVP